MRLYILTTCLLCNVFQWTYSQSICEGEWTVPGIIPDFEVINQNTIQFEDISFNASCALVFSSISSATISNKSFSVTFGNPQVFNGSINGTFTSNGDSVIGSYSLNIVLCNQTLTGNWSGSPTQPCGVQAIFSGSPTSGQAPLSVLFSDNSIGNITEWFWEFGDGEILSTTTPTNPSHVYSQGGVYTVKLTVEGPQGVNTFIRENYIEVLPPAIPTANFSVSPTSGEAPLAVEFTNLSTGYITNILWRFGDGDSSWFFPPVNHTYEYSGIYTVSLTVGNSAGNDVMIQENVIEVTGDTPAKALFSAFPRSGPAPLTVQFINESIGTTANYRWEVGEDIWNSYVSLFDTTTNPIFTFANPGLYDVSLDAFGPIGDNNLWKEDYIIVTPFVSDPIWTSQSIGINYTIESIFFINENIGWVLANPTLGVDSKILKTTDGGSTWFAPTLALPQKLRSTFFVDENNGWVVGGGSSLSNEHIFKTTDGGQNWYAQYNGLNATTALNSVFFINSNLGWAVGVQNGEELILNTTDGGTNWSNQTSNFHSGGYLDVFFVNADTGWAVGAGQTGGKIIKTTDGGANWFVTANETTTALTSVFFINPNIGWAAGWNHHTFFGDEGTILTTTDGGLSWVKQFSQTLKINSIYFISQSVGWIAADFDAGLLKTTDGGLSWVPESGATGSLHSIYFINDSTGWVGGDDGILFKTTKGGLYTSINEESSKKDFIPQKTDLLKNYPNPFNPLTNIVYRISKSSDIVLKIFDISGREIRKIVDDTQGVGEYIVQWDGSDNFGKPVSSGIYIYQLKTREIIKSRKMLLVR